MGEHIIYDSEEKDSDIRFEDGKTNLDMELDGNIVIIADLGLWKGRRRGYKITRFRNQSPRHPLCRAG